MKKRFTEQPLQILAKWSGLKRLKKALECDLPYNEEFYLHKELFGLLFQSYKDSGESIKELIVIVKGLLDVKKEGREEYLGDISNTHRELAHSYAKLCGLADTLTFEAIDQRLNGSNQEEGAKQLSEPYQPYFIQILELEDSLGCEIKGKGLIDLQVFLFNHMCDMMAYAFRDGEPEAFYWNAFVPSYQQFLTFLDQRGEFETFLKKEIKTKEGLFFDIFGKEVTYLFRPRKGEDLISQFYPLVMKYGDIDFMKARFNQRESGKEKWEKDFHWIQFLKDGSEYIASKNPEKAQEYLDRILEIEKGFIEKYIINPSLYISARLPDPFELFLPYLIKYGNIEDGKERFDIVYQKLVEWDKAFEWVHLHVKGAQLLKESNPEKSQDLLDKAKELTKDTLSCYFFNLNRNSWREKETEALRLIQEVEES